MNTRATRPRFNRDPNRRPIPSELPEEDRETWRRLPLHGAHNFRDLGGYTTEGGSRVKWGTVYRADGLHKLTPSDQRYLERVGLRTIIDFRDGYENRRSPDRVPDGVRYETLPVAVGGEDVRETIMGAIKGESDGDLSNFLVDVGEELVESHTPVFARWLRDLATHDSAVPQVFHCTAGKDRTGFAAAILLRILGVPLETIMQDYEQSNRHLERLTRSVIRRVRFFSFFRHNGEVLRPMLTAERRYLEASFAAIESGWGSFDSYVRDGLGLSSSNVEAIRSRLLQ